MHILARTELRSMPKQYSRTSFNVDTEGNMKLEVKTLHESLIGPFAVKSFCTVFRMFEVLFSCWPREIGAIANIRRKSEKCFKQYGKPYRNTCFAG